MANSIPRSVASRQEAFVFGDVQYDPLTWRHPQREVAFNLSVAKIRISELTWVSGEMHDLATENEPPTEDQTAVLTKAIGSDNRETVDLFGEQK